MPSAVILAGDYELAPDLGHIFVSYSHRSMHIDCGCRGTCGCRQGYRCKGEGGCSLPGWVLAPSPSSPLALHQRGPGFMSYTHSIHFPDSLVTTKSRVEKGRDRRAMEATGHLAFLPWSSHYWQMSLHCSSHCQTLLSS